jgi:type II secretory pathway pseudopilin PulG
MKKISAWSLVELLAVVAVLVLVGAMLFPAFARPGGNSHALQCLNNLKQLMAAMQMYSHDHHDLFPPNPDDGNTVPGWNWCPGQAGRGGPQEFNSDILRNPALSLLAAYVRSNAALFRCPADTRSGRSTAPSTAGQTVPAARTISMNGAVGTDPHSVGGQLAVNGPWLDGTHNHTRDGPWFTYGKTTDIVVPAPKQLFVLLDENPVSINDASFAVTMVSNTLLDGPGLYHNFGGSFAFADGRAEIHKWKDARTASFIGAVTYAPPNPDVTWVQERTSAHK